jgi:GrpB-like predicted nucleotidyltransferase (UPF0157 family)/uncharacterized protein YciI
MFLAILRYKVPLEEIEPYRKGHIDFLKNGYANNDFIVSGRMMTGKGGVILSPLTRRGDFEQLLRKDPFKIHDLADYEIIAFEPSRFHPDFASFIREPEREKIELVPYTPEWNTRFKAEAEQIKGALGDTLLEIHHIGSTSIPGIVAKPIIDILPVVKDIHAIDRLTPSLEALGYESRGEFGMPGRRFFIKRQNGKRTFNVHIFEEGHPDIERHFRFRDYMRAHPDEALAYSELKKDLVIKFPDDIEQYCWGKEDFVKAIELKAFLWRTL